MILKEEDLNKTLVENNLTISQYWLLKLLYSKRTDLVATYCKEIKHTDAKGMTKKGFIEYELKDLEDRGFILDFNDIKAGVSDYYPSRFLLTQKTDMLFKFREGDAFEELIDAYPPFISINGRNVIARGYRAGESEYKYYKYINFNIEKHKEILELIKKNKSQISCGLGKFIDTKFWENFSENITFDFNEDI